MKRLASSIILCSLLLFCACECAIENGDGSNEKILLVNLDISVALSDVSDALTRTAKYADAAKRTLESRGDLGTGWSRAWKIAAWARLQDGEHAYRLLKSALDFSTLTARNGAIQGFR